MLYGKWGSTNSSHPCNGQGGEEAMDLFCRALRDNWSFRQAWEQEIAQAIENKLRNPMTIQDLQNGNFARQVATELLGQFYVSQAMQDSYKARLIREELGLDENKD